MANLCVGILGGGVIGMTTALEIQKRYPNSKITIVAENFCSETTSHGAAGIFRPSPSLDFGSESLNQRIIANSYEFYQNILNNNNPDITGVREISGYMFSNISEDILANHYLEKLLSDFRLATKEELHLNGNKWKYGSYFKTLLTECHTLLPWYLGYFKLKGGLCVEEQINILNDTAKYQFDVIFNCTGLGAKKLFHDQKLTPIRGQILQVPKEQMPWQNKFYYGDYDAYIIPGKNYVVLGGCRNFDSYDLSVSAYDTEAIIDRCSHLEPRIKKVTRFKTWVGLRPFRDPVRIQAEIGTPLLIHNYGHGGYGVLSAPGSAMHAVEVFENTFKRSGTSSKL